MRAADALAACLEAWGFEVGFGVPGESYLALLDALHDRTAPRFVACRQEGGAAMAAEAHARMTGRPGLVLVTRGPGLTNASAGIHVARQGSTPLIVLVGMPARETERREAFQELDLESFGRVVAKDAVVIRDAARLPEQLSKAVQAAVSGRPGPVLVGLPEDMLADKTGRIPSRLLTLPEVPRAVPEGDALARAAQLLSAAERPFVIAGGAGWRAEASEALARFAATFGAPVGGAWRRQDVLDNESEFYAGHVGLGIDPTLAERVRAADVLVVAGARLGENTTSGYTLLTPPVAGPRLIHIHPDPIELGAVYRPDVALAGDPAATLNALCSHDVGDASSRELWRTEARQGFEAFRAPVADPGELQLSEAVAHVSATVPPETAITNGAGNYAIWVQRFFTYRRFGQQLGPQSGSMGYGIPAAIGAAFARPATPVVAFAGDGCALMTIQELATIAEHRLPVTVIVVDNARYGTIRMHQERDFPGRVSGTEIASPDFAGVARGFGLEARTVRTTAEFRKAFDAAFASGAPNLLHLLPDRRAIRPGVALAEESAH